MPNDADSENMEEQTNNETAKIPTIKTKKNFAVHNTKKLNVRLCFPFSRSFSTSLQEEIYMQSR